MLTNRMRSSPVSAALWSRWLLASFGAAQGAGGVLIEVSSIFFKRLLKHEVVRSWARAEDGATLV